MSRVGKKPIPVPAGVTVAIKDNVISVKGPKGELTNTFREGISVKAADGHIQVERGADDSKSRAFHGLTRALINNMITGVT
ncbi:MAG: 50S ribosomal protein L6, partial [Candidatus Marinimicrobia bacterium]|nr:50S ribosomal protein L6 [Candidatus Neomarinimicrobiota bacterium]